MADLYYNHNDSVSIELENMDEAIIIRNVLAESSGRLQDNADYEMVQHIINELTNYINQEQEKEEG